MRKITDFIVSKRNIILILFVILTGICLYTSTKVNINSDITKYLPNDSETKIGKEIMDSEFAEQKSSYLNVMFKNLSNEEKKTTYEKLKSIEGVSSVDYDDSEYNKGEYTLYTLNVDDYDYSKTAENIYNEVKENYDVTAMSGSIYDQYKPILQLWIIVLAIGIAMIILTILSESYIEPWLYLLSIGIAVFINKGTNIIFSSVSSITDSITAILQLALSMDYSIMLSNRYRQERETEKDKVKAMKNALYHSFKAISSSSITTVVGLLALVFMSFTIGKDLGFVLAKGVFLSLVSIFFCLPGLLLLFDKLIMNSKKKKINFDLTKMGNFIYKTRWIQLILIIVVFVCSLMLKGNLGVLYTGSEQDEVGKIFPATNQIAIVYENEYEEIISKYCQKIEDDEKANQVLCYGNTINEKLAYDELNDKFKNLGQDTKIDEYLIKIIYYNYYNKNTKDSMTLDEFIKFIKSDVYPNEKINNSINSDLKENMDLLENFSTIDNVNKKRNTSEIAKILGINEKDAEDLLIYYNSQHVDTKMTIKDFVDFMLNEVANDPSYSQSIEANTLSSLKQLTPFTDANIINKKMTSIEIASIFGIDKSLVEQLFLFYRTTIESTSTMTMNEFARFALELKDNPNYSGMFSNDMIEKLTLLEILSNDTKINYDYTSSELAKTLSSIGINNLDNNTLNLLYFYNYYLSNSSTEGYKTTSLLSLNEFVSEVIMDSNISSLIPTSIENFKPILQKFSDKTFVTTKLNRVDMTTSLKGFGFNENQINMIYISMYKKINPTATDEEALIDTTLKLTPYQVLNILKSLIPSGDSKMEQISLLINIMDLSYNQDYKVVPTYDYQTLANYLSKINSDVNVSTVSLGYGYYDYKNNSDKKMSLKELINFIIDNKDNQIIASKLDNNLEILMLAYQVVNNTNTKYSYKDLASLISQPENVIESIYGIADYNQSTTSLSPKEFTELILNNQNNELLSSKIDKRTTDSLNLINTVMSSTLNNTKYNAKDLSKILKSDKDTLSLVMSLYNSRYIKSNKKISLIDFTNFLISDVIPSPKYSEKINNESKNKLITINGVMKNTLSKVKYNSLELYNVLNKLSDDLDYNLLDLVYIYHGSKNSFDNSWQLTVEEIVNYLNDELLPDEKYANFLDDEMTNTIEDAKEMITDAKKLLVTDKYSRAIINSKYGAEDEDTFKFIENIQNEVAKSDGVYVIGDSPMALEMSKTFNDELNYITILTMVFIFVVVAFTFKDLLTSLILVLVIQCAVSITMAILSIAGSNVYFISLLIVQAILMGATIDYAIVYTSYYKESRETLNIKDSIITAYNKSIHTILSSSSILIIVTLIVSVFSEAIAAKICETISQGAFCSAVLILFVLPGILATCDKFICKNVKKYSK